MKTIFVIMIIIFFQITVKAASPREAMINLILDLKENSLEKESPIYTYIKMNCEKYDYKKIKYNKKEIESLCEHYLSEIEIQRLKSILTSDAYNIAIDKPINNKNLRAGVWASTEFISDRSSPEQIIAELLYLKLVKTASLKGFKDLLKKQGLLTNNQSLLNWNLLNYLLQLNSDSPFQRINAVLDSDILSLDEKNEIVSSVQYYLFERQKDLLNKLSVIANIEQDLDIKTNIEDVDLNFSGESYLTKHVFDRISRVNKLNNFLISLNKLDLSILKNKKKEIVMKIYDHVVRLNQFWNFDDFQGFIDSRLSGFKLTYQDLFYTVVFLADYQEYVKKTDKYKIVSIQIDDKVMVNWDLIIRKNEFSLEVLINKEVRND